MVANKVVSDPFGKAPISGIPYHSERLNCTPILSMNDTRMPCSLLTMIAYLFSGLLPLEESTLLGPRAVG